MQKQFGKVQKNLNFEKKVEFLKLIERADNYLEKHPESIEMKSMEIERGDCRNEIKDLRMMSQSSKSKDYISNKQNM